jgi:hypothetical protein
LLTVVQAFKGAVTREIRNQGLLRSDAQLWQRSFYDRVIRNDAELDRVRLYMANNPAQWAFDTENPLQQIDAAYVADWGWLEGSEAVPATCVT